ncbi:MAG: extensin family protein [Rhodobacteraceae bacterium]|nr:extensin family protein [Paracoccaceae bacterium]
MYKSVILFALILSACTRSGAPDLSAYSAGHSTRLCGNPALLGEKLDDIAQGQCRIDNPVAVHVVAGVTLSTPATLNCDTANTLADWVENDAQQAVKKLRSRISSMRVLASYACRTRNSRPGARLSEHALGNAIDLGSFTLENGIVLSIKDDWRRRNKEGKAIRALVDSACGPFGTVLSPDSDRFHQDNLHLDTASYRSGAYCP